MAKSRPTHPTLEPNVTITSALRLLHLRLDTCHLHSDRNSCIGVLGHRETRFAIGCRSDGGLSKFEVVGQRLAAFQAALVILASQTPEYLRGNFPTRRRLTKFRPRRHRKQWCVIFQIFGSGVRVRGPTVTHRLALLGELAAAPATHRCKSYRDESDPPESLLKRELGCAREQPWHRGSKFLWAKHRGDSPKISGHAKLG